MFAYPSHTEQKLGCIVRTTQELPPPATGRCTADARGQEWAAHIKPILIVINNTLYTQWEGFNPRLKLMFSSSSCPVCVTSAVAGER